MPKYENSVIYKLKHNEDYDDLNIYIGSTTNFKNRKNQHKSRCYNENCKDYKMKIYQFIRDNGGWNEWVMIAIQEYPCNSKRELLIKERYYIDLLRPRLNINIPTRTFKEWYGDNKEKHAARVKIYRKNNKEKISKSGKIYREKNKEEISTRKKKYCEDNREEIAAKNKQWREEHREERNIKVKNRRSTDVQYKLACNLRRRLGNVIRGSIKQDLQFKILDVQLISLKIIFSLSFIHIY